MVWDSARRISTLNLNMGRSSQSALAKILFHTYRSRTHISVVSLMGLASGALDGRSIAPIVRIWSLFTVLHSCDTMSIRIIQ